MVEKVLYETDDGKVFKTKEKAEQHEALLKENKKKSEEKKEDISKIKVAEADLRKLINDFEDKYNEDLMYVSVGLLGPDTQKIDPAEVDLVDKFFSELFKMF